KTAHQIAKGETHMVDQDRITGRRIKRLAQEFHCTAAEVNAALAKHPVLVEKDKFLARTLALELVEMDELQEAFRAKAIEECDTAAGALLVEICERRATLLGLNAPQSAAITIIESERPAVTSTERIRAAIDRIRLSRPQPEEPNGQGPN